MIFFLRFTACCMLFLYLSQPALGAVFNVPFFISFRQHDKTFLVSAVASHADMLKLKVLIRSENPLINRLRARRNTTIPLSKVEKLEVNDLNHDGNNELIVQLTDGSKNIFTFVTRKRLLRNYSDVRTESFVTVEPALLGHRVSLENWGETKTYEIPFVSWALALVHAHALLSNAGIPKYSVNAFFATALKESNLKSDLNDGYFQLEEKTAFAELKNLWPAQFQGRFYKDIIGTTHFETAAIAKAFYDVFAWTMLEYTFSYGVKDFVNRSVDPQGAVKLISLAYNRGLWFDEFKKILRNDREICFAKNNLLDCLKEPIAHDHATAISDMTKRLEKPTAWGGAFYEARVSWEQIRQYLDTISAIYPKLHETSIQEQIKEVFDRLAVRGTISFQNDSRALLNAVINITGTIDKTAVCRWYGVKCT